MGPAVCGSDSLADGEHACGGGLGGGDRELRDWGGVTESVGAKGIYGVCMCMESLAEGSGG